MKSETLSCASLTLQVLRSRGPLQQRLILEFVSDAGIDISDTSIKYSLDILHKEGLVSKGEMIRSKGNQLAQLWHITETGAIMADKYKAALATFLGSL